MFIKKLTVQNFRLFPASNHFELDEINIPNSDDAGSGLTVIVGENGCGKTTLLDAIALPLLSYKADSIDTNDFNDLNKDINIQVLSNEFFKVDGTMPNSSFKAKGFSFEGRIRQRDSKTYLASTVVSDQKYIKAEDKPKDNSPDLRVTVNNPFKGVRFNENDILFLDKNRTFQTRLGTYNPTRFDRLMEDFNFQYIKSTENREDIDGKLEEIKQNVNNSFLSEAIKEFEKISGKNITLNLISNCRPFHKSFLAEKKSNNQQIPLSMLGSGYEMIFSLIYAFFLSKQSNKQLIILIDEPELHLHPALQGNFANLLLDLSKSAQIILTTHSPLLVKQLFSNRNIKTKIISNNSGVIEILSVQARTLPYISANEINYLAFGLATVEYHNELYGCLQEKAESYTTALLDNFLESKGITKDITWIREKKDKTTSKETVTLQTFIRHSIHHTENTRNHNYTPHELLTSIKQMINILKKLNDKE